MTVHIIRDKSPSTKTHKSSEHWDSLPVLSVHNSRTAGGMNVLPVLVFCTSVQRTEVRPRLGFCANAQNRENSHDRQDMHAFTGPKSTTTTRIKRIKRIKRTTSASAGPAQLCIFRTECKIDRVQLQCSTQHAHSMPSIVSLCLHPCLWPAFLGFVFFLGELACLGPLLMCSRARNLWVMGIGDFYFFVFFRVYYPFPSCMFAIR